MIIHSENNSIVRGGNIGQEKTMRIKASAKAFQILSSGLYSDKVRAILRETGCNSFDAHVEAGKPHLPFELTLPNSFNPNAIFRDFGKGISPDDIENVYTVLFESTKTESNDVVGCMGLGCKSPLSYTDSFIVESFYEGTKYTYSIYKNESGLPSYLLLAQEKSDEPSGLCVRIPVRSIDFNEFANKAKSVYKHFKIKPVIKGNNVVIPEKKYLLKDEHYGLRDRDYDCACAVFGNISYPLRGLHDDSMTNVHRYLLDLDIDLFFDIGELDVAASREALSYDKLTVANIIKKLDKVFSVFTANIQKEIEKCENLWEARLRYREIVSSQNLNNICESMEIKYKGTVIDGFSVAVRPLMMEGVSTDVHEIVPNFTITVYQKPRVKMVVGNSHVLSVGRKVKFIIDDNDSHKASNRISHAITQDDMYYVFKFAKPEYAEKVLKLIGISEFVKLSDIPVVIKPRAPRGTSTATPRNYNPLYSGKVFLYNGIDASTASKSWDKATLPADENEQVLYVPLDHFKVYGEYFARSFLPRYLEALTEAGVDVKKIKIYGIKKDVPVGKNWVKFNEYVLDYVKKFVDGNEDFAAYCRSRDYCSVSFNYHHLNTLVLCLSGIYPRDKNLAKLNTYFACKPFYQIKSLIGGVAYTKLEKLTKELNEAGAEFVKRYPMLDHVSNFDGTKIQTVVDYMEMVDKNRKA